MKAGRGFGGPFDLGNVFDEIFEAARNFQEELNKNLKNHGENKRPESHPWFFGENTDCYPGYSYPPMNVCMTVDRSLIFEFALAGFEEKDISLSFQGDYMVFSAFVPRPASYSGIEYAIPDNNNIRYLKHRLKMKDIEKQKYFVPLDKYAQDKVKAIFRNGILRVTIPPRDEMDPSNGVRIEIVTED